MTPAHALPDMLANDIARCNGQVDARGRTADPCIECERYDPLMYQCDETLHARPDRKTIDDESVKLVETINSAASVMSRAMAQLERLRGTANG